MTMTKKKNIHASHWLREGTVEIRKRKQAELSGTVVIDSYWSSCSLLNGARHWAKFSVIAKDFPAKPLPADANDRSSGSDVGGEVRFLLTSSFR